MGRLNEARAGHGADPLSTNEQLDQLAARYLDDLLESRTLTPPGYGSIDNRMLSEDVAAAIGERGYWYRYVGVVVAYGESVDNAMSVAAGTPANGPALFEPALSEAGIASAVIPHGAPWIAPPPGGVGRDIELEGMTLVVIVTAGTFRAPD